MGKRGRAEDKGKGEDDNSTLFSSFKMRVKILRRASLCDPQKLALFIFLPLSCKLVRSP
jgi:hypothetical protein